VPETVVPVLTSARLYYDDGSGYQDSVLMVVYDAATWSTVWARATSPQASPPPRPVVDFTREMVVVAGAGRMAPGDQIRVDSAGLRGGYFVAVVRIIQGCQSFPAAAYPLEIVRVTRSDKPATFAERRERAPNCP